MRVLFIIDTLQIGGAEKSLFEISIRLKNIEPIFCTLFSKKPNLVNVFLKDGINVHELDLNYNSRAWFFEGIFRYRKLIKSLKPDCVHAHLFNAEIIARIGTPKFIPLVGAFVNDSYSDQRLFPNSFLKKYKLEIYKYLDKFTAKRVSYFTSITNTIADSNSRALSIPKTKITVIPRGRDIFNFSPSLFSKKEEGVFEFVVIARLLLRKGYFDLIDAISILNHESISNFKCLIAGDGADQRIIQSYAEKKGVLNRIEFRGTVNNVAFLLNHSDCFIMPSHYEGQGGALVEAMLCAKPIIASDIPVFREQVEDNKTALLFKVKDSLSLSNAMKRMMTERDRAVEMGRLARKVAEVKYDIKVIAQKYDEFYLKVINESTSSNSKKTASRC